MASLHSGHGQHADTVSSGSSVHFVVDISSSSDSDEATSRPRTAAMRRRPSSSVRSKVVTVGDEAGPRRAAMRRRPSPPPPSSVRSKVATESATSRRPSSPAKTSAVSVRSSDRSAGDEATSRRKYIKWDHDDEREVLRAMGDLTKGNHGKIPPASLILKELRRNPKFRRRGLRVGELSDKMYWLKRKFAKSADKAAANGGKLRREDTYREKILYETSRGHQLWPEVAADDGAAYLQARGIPLRPRRRPAAESI